MAEKYRFFDAVEDEFGVYDREYNAQEFTDYFKALVTTGIMKGAGDQLAVSTNGSSMITSVSTGIAFLLGRYYENDSFKELTHDTETLGNSRIDRIVIRLDLSTEARYVRAFIKKGVPSTNPVPPTLTQTANLYEISLAQARIVGGQTFIAANAITDERGTDVICPWAGSDILPNFNDDGLAELIEKVDTALAKVDSIYPLTDGPNVKTFIDRGSSDASKNLNNLKETGIYYASDDFIWAGSNPNNFPRKPDGGFYDGEWIIEVRKTNIVGVINAPLYQQVAYGMNINTQIATTVFIRNSNYQGIFNTPWVAVGGPRKQENKILATLQSGWNHGNYGSESLYYWKDEFDMVHVTGHVENTGGHAIVLLPVGYRPLQTVSPMVMAYSSTQPMFAYMINVQVNGYITPRVSSLSYFMHFSFRAEQ